MTQLHIIQESAQYAVTAIAAALGVDVAMIDTNFELIATSETFLEKRGTDINREFIINGVYKTEAMVLPNPGHSKLCAGCRYEGNCPETAEVLRTIRYEGEIIGVILMVAYTQHQKERLLTSTGALLEFIGEIAKLICKEIKLKEMIEQEKIVRQQMETTINFVDSGIIAIDRKGIITQINRRSFEILRRTQALGQHTNIREFLPIEIYNRLIRHGETIRKKEIDTTNPSRIHCLLSGNPITVQGKVLGAVISIEDIAEVRSTVYEFSEKQIQYTLSDILGESNELMRIKEYARQIARNDATVLIQGESGTGKELFARAIHSHSVRADFPFIPVNCAAIPEMLLESELFGYDEGAFSGARKGGKPGKFERAHGGTIFLDEVGDMPLHMQAKLLRVLQEGTIERIGGIKEISVDVRILAATNQNIEQMVRGKQFRKDLYFRLNVMPLQIPPLRARKGDIQILLRHFLDKHNRKIIKNIQGFTGEVNDLLLSYYWPGNVRELENTIEYAVNMAVGTLIEESHLPASIVGRRRIFGRRQSLSFKLRDYEKLIIKEALELIGQSVEEKKTVARELGISLPTLYRKIRELNIKSSGSDAI
jgi:transcriptional regulator with PAS, ATPase and Fis domain